MDSILARAQSRLSEISREIARLSAEKADIETYVALHKKLATRLDASEFSASNDASRFMSEVRKATTKRQQISDAAEYFIRDRGGPIHTRELIDLVESMGIEIGGSDKLQAVSKILGMDSRFVADRKVGWSLEKESP